MFQQQSIPVPPPEFHQAMLDKFVDRAVMGVVDGPDTFTIVVLTLMAALTLACALMMIFHGKDGQRSKCDAVLACIHTGLCVGFFFSIYNAATHRVSLEESAKSVYESMTGQDWPEQE